MGVAAVISQQQRWLNVFACECVPPNDRICLERSPPHDNSDAGHRTRERKKHAVMALQRTEEKANAVGALRPPCLASE